MKSSVILKIAAAVSGTAAAAFIFLFLFSGIAPKELLSWLLPFIFTTINFAAGMLSIVWGIKRRQDIFMIVFFGGMLLRMALMLLALLISLKFLELNLNSFIFLIFIFYIYYLSVELIYLVSRKR